MLLADGGTRLLTLIGPGGCGKTRLALTYTATVATGAKDAGGKPLAQNYTWSFTMSGAPTEQPKGGAAQAIRYV